MVTARWTRKIVAVLHDPPDKPFSIGRHEERANELIEIALGRAANKDEAEQADRADWIASAADRVDFPEKDPQGEYLAAYWQKTQAVLTHPLSGRTLDLGSLADVDVRDTHEAAKKAVKSLVNDVPDVARRFLRLWRCLPNGLAEEFPRVGALFGMLPADTRQPDHPLEQHLSITAAIADALPQPAFLVFSIGPVQEFIAAARRTQDLWMGSWLLSYLSWTAMKSLAEEYGPDVIVFPSLRGQPLCDHWLNKTHGLPCQPSKADLARPTFPNKFVAILPNGEAEDAAKKAEKAVRDEWKRLSEKLYGALSNDFPADDQTQQMWEAQIQGHLEVYWVVLPWIGADNASGKLQSGKLQADTVKEKYRTLLKPNQPWPFEQIYQVLDQSGQYDPNWGTVYSLLYDLADRAFNARKNLRDFVSSEETGEKCTLCGERAALRSANHDARAFWRQTANNRRAQGRHDLKPDGRERLCAVCTVKRFIQREVLEKEKELGLQGSFPSTSEIAAATFKAQILAKIDDENVAQALQDFLNYVEQIQIPQTVSEDAIPYLQEKAKNLGELAQKLLRLDGEYLFTETWTRQNLKEVKPDVTEEQAQEGRRRLARLHEAMGATPKKYYAILYMDGDQMGRWLSGTHETLAKFKSVLHPEVADALRGNPRWQGILDQKRLITPAVHAAISGALASFSLKLVRYVVEERYAGRVVYAGGDDVLAFLPIDHALPAARELRALFSGEVKVPNGTPNSDLRQARWEVSFGDAQCTGYLVFDGEPMLTMGPSATASIGVALAHHLQPLDLVLQAVRRAERQAKQVYGRNAIAIEVLKRSGEELTAGAKWFREGMRDAVGELIAFCELLKEGKLSGKFPHAVHADARALSGVPEEAQKAELRRLLRRHAGESLSQQEKEQQTGEWSNRLMNLVRAMGFEEVARWLLVCSFIVRGDEL